VEFKNKSGGLWLDLQNGKNLANREILIKAYIEKLLFRIQSNNMFSRGQKKK